ncbi:hypothetical protein TWF102_010318 [Orbilia oligospora]|uniref:AAA+ ATPase domain-containing protein n=1 Tax=Orbilia oligospora TaxID=2813651 RepID=A0A7C8J1K0_ORBOL|nr:hypothetical protein TWF102_010318 [Orbilia oligospora]KAF3097083.1 hypothetical protein TWF103_009612 [Orbilia oligospora]
MSRIKSEKVLENENGPKGLENTQQDMGEIIPEKPRVAVKRVDKYFDKQSMKFKYSHTAPAKNLGRMFARYIIVVFKTFTAQGVPDGDEIVIRGDALREALNSNTEDTSIPKIEKTSPLTADQLEHFYHKIPDLRKELRDLENSKDGLEGQELDNVAEKIFQLDAGIQFITEYFSEAIHKKVGLREQGTITFELLWTLFRPGILAYKKNLLGEGCLHRVQRCRYVKTKPPWYYIEASFISFDGEDYGYTHEYDFRIPQFPGQRSISSLPLYPFEFHADREEEEKRLIERAERAFVLNDCAMHMCLYEYKGHALCRAPEKPKSDSEIFMYLGFDDDEIKEMKFNSRGRVIIDPKGFQEFTPTKSIMPEIAIPIARGLFTTEQKLLYSPVLYGFSFGDRIWGAFSVLRLKEVQWKPEIIESLSIPPVNKDFLRSVIQANATKQDKFDDIVQDKGKSLIGLFTGPPGVGKTLTAEVMAEIAERPLYMLSSGELGDNATTVQKALDSALDLGSRWNAVVLLDEADVFLAKRDNQNLNRNAITSVFLRKLEYYQGILLLTTNRLASIDEAFKSRIHIVLEYPHLDTAARREIWNTFFNRAPETVDINHGERVRLSKLRLNGRQIKNIVKLAQGYAAEKKQDITADTVQRALQFSGFALGEVGGTHQIISVTRFFLILIALPCLIYIIALYFNSLSPTALISVTDWIWGI